MRAVFASLMTVAISVGNTSAAVFQFTSTIATSKGERTAYLWIPPRTDQVRGVIMAGMTLMEREFVKDARIRQACADQRLAILFLKCGLGAVEPQKVLDDLANKSGYKDLSIAPLMFVGHSAGGPPAKALAIRLRHRCFGLVQYRGGVPGGEEPVPPGVPALMMIGQFDEFGGTMRDETGRETWVGDRDAMAAFRAQHAGNLGSIVIEPGAGHFAWSDRNAIYLALFVQKAAEACIPGTPNALITGSREPIAVQQVDPNSGWLTDLNITAQDQHQAAAYADYGGKKAKAAWHFDRELAEATVAYHQGGFSKKDQFIKWNDPFWVDAGTRFFFTSLTWVDDGQTLEVHPVYADVYPGQHNSRGPRWPRAGEPVGHSSAPIMVRHVGGPMVAVGKNKLRIKYDNLASATERTRVTFLAYSEGDNDFRYTEHVGMMPRGFRGLTKGADQSINFPPIGNLTANSRPVPLRATSDAGLSVEYYVAYGPATIVDGKLKITELPELAKFPITVKVVAYQFGSGIVPMVKTAEPVEQTIRIDR